MTKFHIETYGCSHNFADSEQMAGLLKEAQFEHTLDIEEADVVIINTCSVKGRTEDVFFSRLDKIKQEYPYKIIIIAGCIPQTDPEKLKNISLLGTRQIHNIVEVVEETLNDNVVKMLETGEMPPLNLPKIRKNPIVEIIPINRGCLSACSFCKTKSARGNLQSYPIEEIVSLANKALREGVKEIWLTSQDVMCYGFDLQTNLAKLLVELVRIEGDFKIRVGMGNPQHLMKIKDELIPLMNNPKIFKFLHLPAQSGSDKVLGKMLRSNTNEEFKTLIKEIKLKVPSITIATDIIVGFPDESEEDYWQTLNLVRELTPDVINISRFWARSKTPAAKMKHLDVDVIKHRSKVLTDIFHNISIIQNEKWLDWEGEIVIDEEGKEIEGKKQWIGRNFAYKPVIVEGEFKLGQKVKVRIFKTGTFELRGRVL